MDVWRADNTINNFKRKSRFGDNFECSYINSNHVFRVLGGTKSFLDVISVGPFIIELPWGYPCIAVYSTHNWKGVKAGAGPEL